ncbi:hypothetical protein [Dechloromonas sp. ZS-1]|uniref:hypothetical protein n=1 Tax=Dechloromonas sp. ZS-1 TaxID=3138067 RepID=UPI0031FD42E3
MSEEMNDLHSALHKMIWNAQEEMIEQGNYIISEWLEKADRNGEFEYAVDWLFNGEGADYIEENLDTLAFKSVHYAIERFDFRSEETDEMTLDQDVADEPKDYYQEVRNWFNVRSNRGFL